jgi:hypothetical protein
MSDETERLRQRASRTLQIVCGCASEIALLVGRPEDFVDPLHMAKSAVGSSRPTKIVDGSLVCTNCGQQITLTDRSQR